MLITDVPYDPDRNISFTIRAFDADGNELKFPEDKKLTLMVGDGVYWLDPIKYSE